MMMNWDEDSTLSSSVGLDASNMVSSAMSSSTSTDSKSHYFADDDTMTGSESATHVFIQANDYSKFQRADRLNWQFDHLFSHLLPVDDSEDNVKVLSVCPLAFKSLMRRKSILDDSDLVTSASPTVEAIPQVSTVTPSIATSLSPPTLFGLHFPSQLRQSAGESGLILVPTSHLHTIYSKYAIVLSIDVSPSMGSVDPVHGDVLFDRVGLVVEKVLRAITEPFTVPCRHNTFLPELHLTIIAIGAIHKPVHTVCQDFVITQENLIESLIEINDRISVVENFAAGAMRDHINVKKRGSWISSDFNIVINNSLLAFDFLPQDACPSLVVITDGVYTVSELKLDQVMKLTSSDVSFTIVNISGRSHHSDHLYTYIPNIELMEFITETVGGTLIDYSFFKSATDTEKISDLVIGQYGAPQSNSSEQSEIEVFRQSKRISLLQYALFFKSSDFQVGKTSVLASRRSVLIQENDISQQIISEQLKDYHLANVDIKTILKTRLKQGFRIYEIHYATGEAMSLTQSEVLDPKSVKLRFLLRPNCEIEYHIRLRNTSSDLSDQLSQGYSEDSSKKRSSRTKLVSNADPFPLELKKHTQLSVKLVLNASRGFHERYKYYIKKYAKPNPQNKNILDITREVTSRTMAYNTVATFAQAVFLEDKMAEQLHMIAETGITNKIQSRSSQGTKLLEYLKAQVDRGSYMFDEESVLVKITPETSSRYEKHGEYLAQNLITRKNSQQPASVGNSTDMTYHTVVSMLRHNLEKNWATTKFTDDFFIKFLQLQEDEDLGDTIDDNAFIQIGSKVALSAGLCTLSIIGKSHYIVELSVTFFNVSSSTRAQILGQISHLVQSTNYHLKGARIAVPSSNSLHKILSKLPKCNDEQQYYLTLFGNSPHYSSYLHHKKWIWTLDENSTSVGPMLSMLFAQRLKEGFSLINLQHSAIFHRSLTLESDNVANRTFSIYYCVHLLKFKRLITEVWLEPQSGNLEFEEYYVDEQEVCRSIQDWFYAVDSEMISMFWTFSRIYNACMPLVNQSTTQNNQTANVQQSTTGPSIELIVFNNQQSYSLDKEDSQLIPLNCKALFRHGFYHNALVQLFHTDEGLDKIVSANQKMYDRLLKLVIVLNDAEIPFIPDAVPFVFKESRLPEAALSKARCFVKIVRSMGRSSTRSADDEEKKNPNSILLTLVPDYSSAQSLEIIICECQEDNLQSLASLTLPDNEITGKLFKEEPIVRISRSTSNSSISSIQREDNLSILSKISPECYQYNDFLVNYHSLSFAFGVYRCLQAKEIVEMNSFVSAVEACVEYREEIDLTEFFEAILLSKDYFFHNMDTRTTRSPNEEMNSYFARILKKYFDIVPGTDHHYYYREKSIKSREAKLRKKPPLLRRNSKPKLADHFEEINNDENFNDEEEAEEEEISDELESDNTNDEVSSISEHGSISSSGTYNMPTDQIFKLPNDLYENLSEGTYISEGSSGSFAFRDSPHAAALDSVSIPVFMRMECVVSNDGDTWVDYDEDNMSTHGSNNASIFPVTNLPVEKIAANIKDQISKQSKEPEFEAEQFGVSSPDTISNRSSEQMNPEQSALLSMRSSLRFYCITLPPDKLMAAIDNFEPQKKELFKYLYQVHDSNQFSFAKSKFKFEEEQDSETLHPSSSSPYLPRRYLPKHLRNSISGMKKRIQALISKEILNALMHTPITPYVLKKVFDHVQHLPSSVYCKYSLPFEFINAKEGVRLFHQEIVRCKTLVFKKVETSYVIYFRKNGFAPYYSYQEERAADDKTEEFTPLTTNDVIFFDRKEAAEEIDNNSVELPYWLVVTVTNSATNKLQKQLSVLFYSPYPISAEKKQRVTSTVDTVIGAVCKRVNTLILLNNLHETKICSSLLLPASTADKSLEDKGSIEKNPIDVKFLYNAKPDSTFKEGVFACPLVHAIRFKLHRRLQTDLALRSLIHHIFEKIAVTNRGNVFVYKEKSGHVFYMRLSESSQISNEDMQRAIELQKLSQVEEESESVVGSPRSPRDHDTASESEGAVRINSLKNYSLSASTMGHYLVASLSVQSTKPSLVLEVYGVHVPSSEITVQLQNAMETRLSAMTMSIISNLLLRNNHFKLNVEDLEFIRPFTKRPDKVVSLEIPPIVQKIFLFLLMTRENLQEYLNRLYLCSSTTNDQDGDLSSSMTEDDADTLDYKPLEFTLLYNSVPQTYTRSISSQAICKGIACVQFRVLNKDNKIVKHFGEYEAEEEKRTGELSWNLVQAKPFNHTYNELGGLDLESEIEESDNESEEDVEPEEKTKTSHQILVEVWKKGDIDIQALVDRIVLTINQTVCDYVFEERILASPVDLSQYRDQFLFSYQLTCYKARQLRSASVQEFRQSTFLPVYEMDRFMVRIHDLLSKHKIKMDPVILASIDGKASQFSIYNKRLREKISDFVGSNNICFSMIGGRVSVDDDGTMYKSATDEGLKEIIAQSHLSYKRSPGFQYSRNASIMVIVKNIEVIALAYNWKASEFEKFKQSLSKLISWTKCRILLVNSILHQKTGLFFHSKPKYLTLMDDESQKDDIKLTFNNIDILIYNQPEPRRQPTRPLPAKEKTPTSPQQNTLASFKNGIPNRFSKNNPMNQLEQQQQQQQQQQQVKRKPIKARETENSPVKLKKTKQKVNRYFGFLLKGVQDVSGRGNQKVQESAERRNDPLLSHGAAFKHIIHRNHRQAIEKLHLARIYNCWNKMQTTDAPAQLSPQDYQLIKNTSRLFHYCRVPLFFNPLRKLLFNPQFSMNSAVLHSMSRPDAINSNMREIGHHKKVFESFLGEYVMYIESLGVASVYVHSEMTEDMSPIPSPRTEESTFKSTDSDNSPSNSRQAKKSKIQVYKPRPLVQIGEDIAQLPPTTVYFQKTMNGGVLFLELGLDSIYAYLNVYVSDMPDQRSDVMSPVGGYSSTRSVFLEKTAQFKHKLHMNSFAYDFHMRNFHNYINNENAEYPTNLNFLDMVRDYKEFFPQTPIYSRNVLRCHDVTLSTMSDIAKIASQGKSGSEEMNSDLEAYQQFFEYTCKYANRYGIVCMKKLKGCFILDRYRPNGNDKDDHYSYSVVAFINPDQKEQVGKGLSLRLYIIFVNTTTPYPHTTKTAGTKQQIFERIDNLVRKLDDKLVQVLEQSKNDYVLETLWNMALRFKLTDTAFEELKKLGQRIELKQLDRSLDCFDSTCVPWSDIISQLWNRYGSDGAGSLFKKDGSTQHFLIRCRTNEDILLHMEFKIFENSMKVHLIRRVCNKNLANSCSDEEADFVSEFVNHVCVLLWRLAISDNHFTKSHHHPVHHQ